MPLPHHQPLPPEFASALAQASERLGSLVRQVHWFSALSSTNDVAAEYAARGAAEGVVVIARTQSAGRGRFGRTWQSPPDAGLYASILLRPASEVVPLLTLAAGVALADGIRAATALETTVKWPNDVYVGDRKLAGILAEAGAASTGLSHVVVGFGVNLRRAVYSPEVASRVTSIEGELGRTADAGMVLVECLAALSARYDDLRGGRSSRVLGAWRAYARPMLGRRVEWDDRGGARQGVAEDVDGTGALVIRTDAGLARVISGEVRWI